MVDVVFHDRGDFRMSMFGAGSSYPSERSVSNLSLPPSMSHYSCASYHPVSFIDTRHAFEAPDEYHRFQEPGAALDTHGLHHSDGLTLEEEIVVTKFPASTDLLHGTELVTQRKPLAREQRDSFQNAVLGGAGAFLQRGARRSNSLHMIACICVLLLAPVYCVATPSTTQERYKSGEHVPVECQDWHTGDWLAGPICKENGKPLVVDYGLNSFIYCGLEISNQSVYEHIVGLINLTKTWNCRVAKSKDKKHYVPFTMTMWGVVEADHVHVEYRTNLIFHVDNGHIIAAAAYPLTGRVQLGKVGVTIQLSGAVRWFQGTSFSSVSNVDVAMPETLEHTTMVVFSSGAVSCLATLLLTAVLYQRKLKPALINKYRKKE